MIPLLLVVCFSFALASLPDPKVKYVTPGGIEISVEGLKQLLMYCFYLFSSLTNIVLFVHVQGIFLLVWLNVFVLGYKVSFKFCKDVTHALNV